MTRAILGALSLVVAKVSIAERIETEMLGEKFDKVTHKLGMRRFWQFADLIEERVDFVAGCHIDEAIARSLSCR